MIAIAHTVATCRRFVLFVFLRRDPQFLHFYDKKFINFHSLIIIGRFRFVPRVHCAFISILSLQLIVPVFAQLHSFFLPRDVLAKRGTWYCNFVRPAVHQSVCPSHLLRKQLESAVCHLIVTQQHRFLSSIDKVKVKVHTLDIAPLRSETPPQKSSGMACVPKGSHSFTCTLTRSSAIGMSHTCLCLPSRSWYSFTDSGRMEC